MIHHIDKGQSTILANMTKAINILRKKGVLTVALTNKWYTCDTEKVLSSNEMLKLCSEQEQTISKQLLHYFDVFLESRVIHKRKTQQDIYDYTLKLIKDKIGNGTKTKEIAFLDDIPENLIPFKNMGVNVIHVVNPDQALKDLELLIGYSLRE
jgi:FMN phosphatase YigB (HAD superfamily)